MGCGKGLLSALVVLGERVAAAGGHTLVPAVAERLVAVAGCGVGWWVISVLGCVVALVIALGVVKLLMELETPAKVDLYPSRRTRAVCLLTSTTLRRYWTIPRMAEWREGEHGYFVD